MKKTVYVAWNGTTHPITTSADATVGQILASPKVRAALGLPDNCIAVYNGAQHYDGPIDNLQTVQIISQPAAKA